MTPAVLLAAIVFAAPGEATPVEFAVYDGYFENNTSGLKGDASYLLLRDRAAFDKVFGATPPLGGKPRKLLGGRAFDEHAVAAVVKRGHSTWAYKVASVKRAGGTLTVDYTATATDHGDSATFASPLVVRVPKDVKKVVFVENGKEVGTAE